MKETRSNSYYDILDVSLSSKPEMIRTAYIRAKNTYSRDSLAVYTLFEPEESKKILEQIEEAYSVLSDPEQRKKYDEAHGFMSFDDNIETARVSVTMQSTESREADVFLRSAKDVREFIISDQQDDFNRIEESQKSSAPMPTTSTPETPREIITPKLTQASFTGPKVYRVQREYQANPEMEEKIKNHEPVDGAFLKAIRDYRCASMEEMMDITKISKNYLEAIESDNFSKLPATVYVRGFIAQYAKALSLDGNRITTSYMNYLKSKRP